VRAEAPPCGGSQILAPLASAREHLRHPSTASDKKPVPVSLPNQNRKLAAARATLRIAKPQNDKKRRSNNRPQTTIPYQSSRAITPPADCWIYINHAGTSRSLHHSGCEVAGGEDKHKSL